MKVRRLFWIVGLVVAGCALSFGVLPVAAGALAHDPAQAKSPHRLRATLAGADADPAACDPDNPPAATPDNPGQVCLTVTAGSSHPSVTQQVTYTASTMGRYCSDCLYGPMDDSVQGHTEYTFTTSGPDGAAGPSQGPGDSDTFDVTYPTAGTWTLTVTVTVSSSIPENYPSSTTTNQYTVTVNPALSASLSGPQDLGTQLVGSGEYPHFGPNDGNLAQIFYFHATGDGGDSRSYSFSYTLNGQPVSSEPCPSYLDPTGPADFCGNFTPSQDYVLRTTVTDASGATASKDVRFAVTDSRYGVTLDPSQQEPIVGESVTYRADATLPAGNTADRSATRSCTDCVYTFSSTDPNGNPGPDTRIGPDPTFTLTPSTTGRWTISVTASEPDEGDTTATEQVEVYPDLTGSIKGPSSTTVGAPATFSAVAAGGYAPTSDYTYSFRADGGQPFASGANPTAGTVFSTAGNHTVSATIADGAHPAHTIVRSMSVAVAPAPVPSFTADPSKGLTAGDSASFAASVSGGVGPYRYAWDFGDGGTAGGRNVKHTFAGGGTFSVSLTVTDVNGASATTSRTFTVSGRRAASCLGSVAFALTEVTSSGCLVKRRDGTYTTTDGAKVDGLPLPTSDAAHPIVLTPPGAQHPGGHLSAPDMSLVLDGFHVYSGSVDWELPAGGIGDSGRVASLSVPGGAKVKGLPVQGSVSLKFGRGVAGRYYSSLPLHVVLPPAFKAGPTASAPSASGDASIRVDDEGVHYDGLKVRVENVWIGDVEARSVCFSYVPGGASGAVSPCATPALDGKPYLECGSNPTVDRWDGNAVLTLPTPSRAELAMFGGLSGGSLAKLGVFADNLGTSVPIVPGVFLTRVGVGLCLNPPPLELRGDVGAGLLPTAGSGALSVDGSVLFKQGNPWSLALSGTVYGLGGKLKLGSGSLTLVPQSHLVDFSLSSGFDLLGIVSVSGKLTGWLETRPAAFNLHGNGKACIKNACGSAESTVSSKGVAGCVDLGTIKIYYPDGVRAPTLSDPDPIRWASYSVALRGGFGYRWGAARPSLLGSSCDMGDYSMQQAMVARAGLRAAPRAFRVAPHTPALAVRVSGRGGAPAVKLSGPNGRVVAPPTGGSGRLPGGGIYVENPRDDSTSVLLMHPHAGRWRVSLETGSVSVTAIQTARSLTPPVAGGAIGRLRRGRLLLGYGYRLPRGERMKLFVAGPGHTVQPLGVAHGGRCPRARHRPRGARCGKRIFRPLAGPAGRRTVYGVVYRHGLAQRRLEVASIRLRRRSPRPPRPSVKISRRHGVARVSWKPVRHAKRYAVTVKVSDGRVITRTVDGRLRLRVARVGRRRAARAMVWAITRTTIASRPGGARLRAQTRRRHRKHHKHRKHDKKGKTHKKGKHGKTHKHGNHHK